MTQFYQGLVMRLRICPQKESFFKATLTDTAFYKWWIAGFITGWEILSCMNTIGQIVQSHFINSAWCLTIIHATWFCYGWNGMYLYQNAGSSLVFKINRFQNFPVYSMFIKVNYCTAKPVFMLYIGKDWFWQSSQFYTCFS